MNIHVNGEDIDAVETNQDNADSLIMSGLNLIRMLQDRSIDFSKGGFDWFGDAYTDSNGRMNSVDTSLTTALYDTENDSYNSAINNESASDTTHDPDSFTDPSNAFDGDLSTYATKTSVYDDGDHGLMLELGKTFSSKYIGVVYVKMYALLYSSVSVATTCDIYLQTYDGSTWTTASHIKSLSVASGGLNDLSSFCYNIDDTVQGVRILSDFYIWTNSDNQTVRIYSMEYGDLESGLITHNITSGSFIGTISKSIGVPLISNIEDGANIQFKLTNATEDSGYMDYNELTAFTGFTSEATKLIVNLIPNTHVKHTEK